MMFDLVVNAGAWISFSAMDLNAASPALKDGSDVVIYHGTARPTFGGSQGLVYLFKDTMIVQVGVKTLPVQKRTQISIDAPVPR